MPRVIRGSGDDQRSGFAAEARCEACKHARPRVEYRRRCASIALVGQWTEMAARSASGIEVPVRVGRGATMMTRAARSTVLREPDGVEEMG